MKAAIIGGGVIGGGWAARFMLNGWDVAVSDPDPQAARKIGAVLDNARRALPALYDRPLPTQGKLSFAASLKEAVDGADWVQESVPERLEVKHAVFDQIDAAAGSETIIASSTSGFKPSELNENGAHAIVAHPFNPVYLLPLVELVGDPATCARAADILRGLGMFPLTLRKEIDAHIADRLMEAVWRESLWLVKDGIATTEEIDEAIRMGFGLRWAQMGLFEIFNIAGGEAGMRHFLAQFGPALKWPWTRLMDVPEFTPELVELIAGQCDDQSGHMSIRALERLRDDNLVGMMRALKQSGSGAGGVIRAHEAALGTDPGDEALPVTLRLQVPPGWADYNGHMNETHTVQIASKATDAFMVLIGADADYVAAGGSYFTVENVAQYVGEAHVSDRLAVRTQVLDGSGKRMHLHHRIENAEGQVVSTVETFLLHVDLRSRKSAPPGPAVAAALGAWADRHASLPAPEGLRLGRWDALRA